LGLKIRLGTEKCEDEGEGMGNGGGGKFLVNKGGMHGRLGKRYGTILEEEGEMVWGIYWIWFSWNLDLGWVGLDFDWRLMY